MGGMAQSTWGKSSCLAEGYEEQHSRQEFALKLGLRGESGEHAGVVCLLHVQQAASDTKLCAATATGCSGCSGVARLERAGLVAEAQGRKSLVAVWKRKLRSSLSTKTR